MKTLNRFVLIAFWALILTGFNGLYAQEIVPFVNHAGIELEAKIDDHTGTATRIYGIREPVSLYGITTYQLDSVSVTRIGSELINAYSDQLGISASQVKVRKVETDGDWWFTDYKQFIQGIPVIHSEIGFTIDPDGNIVALGAFAFPDIKAVPSAQLSGNEAIRIAQKEFAADSTGMITGPKLVILPVLEQSDYSYFLSWEITLRSLQPVKNITYYIHAQTGKILQQVNNVRDGNISGTISGGYWLESADDTPATDGLFSRIKVYNSAGQLVSNALSDSDGNYSTGFLAFAQYRVVVHLANSWVQIRDNASSGDPVIHEVWRYPGEYNYQWNASDGTNVQWHATYMHNFFAGSPFNYSGMDYQMRGYINAGPGINGRANGTDIFFGSDAGQPWARSRDVVTHEYTHNVIYHIYGGFIGNICDPRIPGHEYFQQSCAMDEGISDYFAATSKITPNPVLANDITGVPGLPRNLDNGRTWDNNPFAGAHENGQVIGGALWRTRQAIGNATVGNNLAFKALQITPHATDFEDYLYNVYLADNGEYNGNYRTQITNSFDHHGIVTEPPAFPPSVSISGPSNMMQGTSDTFTANVSDGSPPLHYTWYYRHESESSWTVTGSNSSTYNHTAGEPNGEYVRVVVNDADSQSDEDIHFFTIIGWAKIVSGTSIPEEYSLSQNYPNPFNPATTIRYELPERADVTLEIYNIMGQRIATLVSGAMAAGRHTTRFEADGLASGIYMARFAAEGASGEHFSKTIELQLIK